MGASLVSAHEGGRTEHAVLTRYHGRDCTQREHERVHEHKRTWLYPSDPNDASLRFLSTGGWLVDGGLVVECASANTFVMVMHLLYSS